MSSTQTSSRAGWMAEGSFGLMVHWLAPGPQPKVGEYTTDLNEAVDAFDLEGFLADFAATDADWLIFTVGQNTGYYCSPNSFLDSFAGPGHCSRRDLVLEIAERIHTMGKRFIAYLPTEVKGQKADIHEAFAWNPKDQTEFQTRYCRFVREFSVRFGELLSGWWFDGCYTWPEFHSSRYDWPLWADAARAGNPNAAIAFNDGSFCVGIREPLCFEQDYLSGEVEALVDGQIRLGRGDDAPLYLPSGALVPGTNCQWHALVPLDCLWAHESPGPMPSPRYADDELERFLRSCRSVGGAVTFNVGIYQEGRLADESTAQLGRIRKLH